MRKNFANLSTSSITAGSFLGNLMSHIKISGEKTNNASDIDHPIFSAPAVGEG